VRPGWNYLSATCYTDTNRTSNHQQGGILTTRHYRVSVIVSLSNILLLYLLLFVQLPAERDIRRELPWEERRWSRCTHTCIITSLRPISPSFWLVSLFLLFSFLTSSFSFPLSFFFVLSLVSASRRVANLRRIHAVDGPSGTKTVAQTYVIAASWRPSYFGVHSCSFRPASVLLPWEG